MSSLVGLMSSCQFRWIVTGYVLSKCGPPKPQMRKAMSSRQWRAGTLPKERSNAAPLTRAAAVVRDGGDIADAGDIKSSSLQRAKRRLAARTGSAHLDL